MSPKSLAALAGRGRRTPGKPGRFDPSEPLHMTTRTAARRGPTNGSSSINGSVDDDESRRGSMDDIRPTTSYSLGSQNSAKGRRTSDDSLNGASDVNILFETRPSAEKNLATSRSKPLSPILLAQSPSRKRKRSTPTPPDTPDRTGDGISPPINDIMCPPEGDFVEVVPFEDLSDRESEGTPPSDEQYAGDYMGVTQSTELTPAATPAGSEAVSPVSDDSHAANIFALKPADVILAGAHHQAEAEEQEEIDEADDLAEADYAEDAEDVDDGDEQARVDGDGRPRRRIAGRRRADHHEPHIEATMRRQLALKSAYRAIARALKPVLAEIAQKTIEDLDANPNLHEQVVEYEGIDNYPGIHKLLDDALDRRKSQLLAQQKWNKSQLQKTLEGERAVRKSRCGLQINNLRDLQLNRLEHDILMIARRAQMDSGDGTYETEDEDGDVIPMVKSAGYRFVRSDALESKYDSRSRVPMATESFIDDLHRRYDMYQMLKELQDEDRPEDLAGFTTMDKTPREAASARRQDKSNMDLLADAATENERISNIPIIPNGEAYGLQLLGNLASRPSIRALVPPAKDKDIFLGSPPPPNMPPPPPMRPPFESPSYDVSPRAAGVRERISSSVPPPSSSRDGSIQDVPRGETPLFSPTSNGSRGSLFAPLIMQAPDREVFKHLELPPLMLHNHNGLGERSPARYERTASLHSRTQSREESTWDKYHRPLQLDRETRPPAPFERSIHDFSRAGPLSIERVEPIEAQNSNPPAQRDQEPIKAESPSNHPLHPRPSTWDPPSSPGAADSRLMDERAAPVPSKDLNKDLNQEVAAKSRSRASSIISQSTTTDASPDSGSLGDSTQRRPRHKGSKDVHPYKPNKAERNGLPRRMFKGVPKEGRRQSRASPHSETKGPTVHRFRLNSTIEAPTTQPAPWANLPPAGPPHLGPPPNLYFPPSNAYGPQHPVPPPPPPPPPPHYNYSYDHQYHHRNSFPGPPPQTWPHQATQDSHYAPSANPGPPTGLPYLPGPSDQWPLSNVYTPSPSRLGPSTPVTPQPSASYGQRFGGPPIAPATSDHRSIYSSAGPQNHPPAFAQQQRNSDGNSRRRTQSDVQHHKFQHWAPRIKPPPPT